MECEKYMTKVIKPNDKQQQAIDILKGQVMLLAGPGTGKTFTVINRIEKMLADGVKPSSILCLTFSDAAANEMRQRLIKKMGVIASSVDIFTYHSFCNEIIKNNPAQFELGIGVRLINDNEKNALMKECIDELELECFIPKRADRYHFVSDFISYVEKLKSARVTKEQYFELIETNPNLKPKLDAVVSEIYEREQRGEMRNIGRYQTVEKIKTEMGKAKDLWAIYELYSQKMINKDLIDFSDMINFVLNAFENDLNFLQEVSNKYTYFLVDEYQDTNNLQNTIIFNLLEGNNEKNIFVVGDDDQIIYGFQGARVDNIENFLNKYPDTKVICLEESNRSTSSILDFSYALISQDENRLEYNQKYIQKNIKKKLTAKNEEINKLDKKVRRIHFGETMQEYNHIVDEIDSLIKSDNFSVNEKNQKDLSQIAIICKKRDELNKFAQMLKGKNIPFQIDKGKSIFEIKSTIVLYFYLKALNNYLLSSDKLFGLMLSEPFKLDLEDYNKILHEKQLLKKGVENNFISIMKRLKDWKNPEKINNFLDTFEDLTKYASTNSIRNTVIEIINRTGILKAFFEEPKSKMENLMGIKRFIEEARAFGDLDPTYNIGDFVKYLDDSLVNSVDISTEKDSIVQNAIQLTTYHGSKGREFDYVYLPNLISRNWENFTMPGEYHLVTEEVLEKEEADKRKDTELLKLLFVGITRAKHSLTISFSDMNDGKANQITKYLVGLADYDFDGLDVEYKEEDFPLEFVRSISTDVFEHKKAFLEEIKQRVEKTVLSPSRLNDYLSCPRKFFYTKILEIDVEEGNWDGANFGTLIHSILENAVRIAKEKGAYPSIEKAIADFYIGLDNCKFTSEAMKEKYEKLGINAINNYYPHFIQLPIESVEDIEFSFYGVDVDGDLITGKIDRIEKNNDGTYSLYDYKTGEPVSPKQIDIGGTKENYHNQLCFYKYAYEKYTGNKVSQVGIIYVENHTKSVFKELCSYDMEYIENKIKETYNNIKELNFNPINEDKQGNCKFCAYKQLCKLDLI